MIKSKKYDTVIIGAGAAGMAAACEIAAAGFKVAILDREDHLGGILMQCIHNGFGLHHFKEELTGPEYAEEYVKKLISLPIAVYTRTTAVDIKNKPESKCVRAYSGQHGVLELDTKSIVLAMGCRERNRGNIGTPGTRVSGIFTAGLAQRLLNIDGCLPGKKVVIVGSGDIGLIMARRMTWTGAKVLCVVEILPYPSGLTRNIVQCLQDFNIPLYLSHAVTGISGRDRVSGVEISPLVNGAPHLKKKFQVPCDTVLLSVGLIPENELSRKAGVILNPDTNGPVVDHTYQTNIDGIFACGNVLHVHDLVDFVSDEATKCGKSVGEFLSKDKKRGMVKGVPVTGGSNLKYVIPNQCIPAKDSHFYMRALVVKDRAELIARQDNRIIYRKKLRYVKPAEMISVTLNKEKMKNVTKGNPLEFAIG